MISSEFPQPSNSLHETVLSDGARESENGGDVGVHLHVGSSGPVLVEDDEGLGVGDAGAPFDFLVRRQLEHFPLVGRTERNAFELFVFVELWVFGDVRHNVLPQRFACEHSSCVNDARHVVVIGHSKDSLDAPLPQRGVALLYFPDFEDVLDEHVQHLAVGAFDFLVAGADEPHVSGQQSAVVLGP